MRRLLLALSLLALACTPPQSHRPVFAATYGGQGALPSVLSSQLLRCQTLAGIDASGGFMWDDFVSATVTTNVVGWRATTGGSGAITTNVAGTAGGIAEVSSGATAGSQSFFDNVVGLINNISTSRWCVVSRFKLITAVTANTVVGVGLDNRAQGKFLTMGVNGAISAANFTLSNGALGAATGVNYGVAVDTTTFHLATAWGVGDSNLSTQLDGGAVSTVALSAPAADFYNGFFIAQNGADAVNRAMDLDYILVNFQRLP